MNTKLFSTQFLFVTAAIVLAAFSRLVPHPYNFSPLGAIAVFGAAYFSNKKYAIIIPLLATWLSDLFINNVIYAQYYPTFTWLSDGFYWTYGAYVLIAFVSIFIFKSGVVKLPQIIAGGLTSSTIFFLVTNLACWPGNTMYAQNMSGLIACYAAGIPFLKGTLGGDLFYTALLFGSYALAKKPLRLTAN